MLTLSDALQLALANNPELRASSARIDAASGRAYQAKLWSNPELTFNAEDWPVSGGDGFSDCQADRRGGANVSLPRARRSSTAKSACRACVFRKPN